MTKALLTIFGGSHLGFSILLLDLFRNFEFQSKLDMWYSLLLFLFFVFTGFVCLYGAMEIGDKEIKVIKKTRVIKVKSNKKKLGF